MVKGGTCSQRQAIVIGFLFQLTLAWIISLIFKYETFIKVA